MTPLFRLLALGMELPEDIFVDMHKFDAPGETWRKYQFHHLRPTAYILPYQCVL